MGDEHACKGKKTLILIHFPDNNGLLVQETSLWSNSNSSVLLSLGKMAEYWFLITAALQSSSLKWEVALAPSSRIALTLRQFPASWCMETFVHPSFFLLDCIIVVDHMVTPPLISSTVYIYSTHTYFFQPVSHKVRCNSSNVIKTGQKLL